MAKPENQDKTAGNAKGGQREAAAYITSKDTLDGAAMPKAAKGKLQHI